MKNKIATTTNILLLQYNNHYNKIYNHENVTMHPKNFRSTSGSAGFPGAHVYVYDV